MTLAIPASPQTLVDATWETLAPHYEALASAPVSRETAEAWLRAWSELSAVVDEAGTLAMIAYTCDTADPAKEAANLRWSSEIFPKVGEQNVRLAERLVAIGWSRDDMAVVLDEFRTDIEIFREANVPLFAELEEHSAAYQKITGGLEAEWEGERVTIPQLQPHLKVRDRAVRERAFRLGAEAYLAQREALAALFDTMFALRQRLAANAGFANYMEYAFRAKHRFDYSPADCARFHAAVEATAAPAVERLMAHRRESLGVATVRPWDTLVQLESERPGAPLPRHGRFRGAGQAHLRCARPGAGGAVPRDGRGRAARPREPTGQGPRRLLHQAPMARPAVHLHERGRRAG
ncbi:MAG: hypothetical protein IPN47_11650 [Gemmatimonadetes bacterium]|nr:hypothetical protein [Gemmatimonadota bacterium]